MNAATLGLAPVALGVVLCWMLAPVAVAHVDDDVVAAGATVYVARCSSCHGEEGAGTTLGPSLVDAGAAAADFVLATGRMPAAGSEVQPQGGPHRLREQEIDAVVAFVATLGSGPSVPVVDLAGADVAAGGVAFRENCAACHQSAGAGASLSDGRSAPALEDVAPTQIVEAMMVGPGAMPVFSSLGDQDMRDVAAYIRATTSQDDPGGLGLGRVGPVAEGLVAWAGGLVPLGALAWWVGGARGRRDA